MNKEKVYCKNCLYDNSTPNMFDRDICCVYNEYCGKYIEYTKSIQNRIE